MGEPRGIEAFDLALPIRSLAAQIAEQAKYAAPLRLGLSAADRGAHERWIRQRNRERELRVARETEDAVTQWIAVVASLTGNEPALAALRIHQPERGYGRAVCSECRESDMDDTVPVAWPCGTYTAIKGATDG